MGKARKSQISLTIDRRILDQIDEILKRYKKFGSNRSAFIESALEDYLKNFKWEPEVSIVR